MPAVRQKLHLSPVQNSGTGSNLDNLPFDFLAGLLVDENFQVIRAALVPVGVVWRLAIYVAYTNSWRFLLPVPKARVSPRNAPSGRPGSNRLVRVAPAAGIWPCSPFCASRTPSNRDRRSRAHSPRPRDMVEDRQRSERATALLRLEPETNGATDYSRGSQSMRARLHAHALYDFVLTLAPVLQSARSST